MTHNSGTIGGMQTIAEFLKARLAEDEAKYHPGTVVVSGGFPAPEVPNCIGQEYKGCQAGWELTPPADAPEKWWKASDVQTQIRAHELTHATPLQRRMLAECAAKRAIIAFWGAHASLDGPNLLSVMATVYKSHPDYRQEWA